MLNKLLKRCMPWMDKGRWYKLTLEGTSDNYAIDHDKSDPIFSNATVTYIGDSHVINIMSPGFIFLDIKGVIEYDNTLFSLSWAFNSAVGSTVITPSLDSHINPDEGITMTFYIFGR